MALFVFRSGIFARVPCAPGPDSAVIPLVFFSRGPLPRLEWRLQIMPVRPQCRVTIIAALLAVAGSALSSGALAQDSVSSGNGLPGDAVGQFTMGAGTEQINNYVVDLTGITSSWGSAYRLGPVAKSSNASGTFFNHLIGAQALSSVFTTGAYLRTSYAAWHAAGQGVNFLQNTSSADDGSGRYGIINTTGLTGAQFGLAFMEFGGGPNGNFGDGDDEQGLVSAVINFDPLAPQRLFVSRINAAVNKPSTAAGNTATASIGLGGVDATGTVHALVDGYGLASGGAVSDKRLIRIAAASRNGASLNQISSSGGSDATAGVYRTVFQSQITQIVPTIIPAAIAGRPVMVSGDFSGAFLSEQTANSVTSSTGHLPAGGTPRGSTSFSRGVFSRLAAGASDAGTSAVLSRASGQTRTRGVSAWGLTTTGTITSALRAELPTAAGQITDPTDGFDPATAAGFSTMALQELTNYASQASFRGGSGPVAMTVLPATAGGDLLMAATAQGTGMASSSAASMDNYLAVARVSAATGGVIWTVAAHSGSTSIGTGKVLLGDFGADGIPGTADAGEGDGLVDRGGSSFIGRIARYGEVVSGATTGPSISSPAMDALGNLYFLATVSLKRPGGPLLTTALIRANFVAQTSGYELELLSGVGDVITGANSTLNYQIQFMGTADSDSIDSGAIWSSSIVQDVLPGTNAADVGYASPQSLGALIVRCKVVYDRNSDGQYRDPTVAGNSGSPDQGYNVAMVVMPGPAPAPGDPADFNGDGEVNPDDLADYIGAFFAQPPDPRADFNGDGTIDPDDLADYIGAFFS